MLFRYVGVVWFGLVSFGFALALALAFSISISRSRLRAYLCECVCVQLFFIIGDSMKHLTYVNACGWVSMDFAIEEL